MHFTKKEYCQLETTTKKLGFKTVDKIVNTAITEFIRNEVIEKEERPHVVWKKVQERSQQQP